VSVAARWRWKPLEIDSGVITTGASNTVNAAYVLLSDRPKTLTTNQSAYRTPLIRPKSVVSLVRSLGDRNGGRGGVLSVAGLPARSHPGGSVQSLVDGMLITLLGIFVMVVVAAMWLARRRRRAVAAATRSYDEYDVDDDDDDCVELGELVTELDDWSHDDCRVTTVTTVARRHRDNPARHQLAGRLERRRRKRRRRPSLSRQLVSSSSVCAEYEQRSFQCGQRLFTV